ncbi:MAG: hypothetical protein A3C35_03860 [Omnitrophica bacterium RIFCSPHIGHO2_02_FULL_46_11]|nr:MAG: hypothetical protein A3A81_07080 [Omnitrophica bacterium RIFCSPLOWO2_01_FULL_45_10b]OGW86004.1 MAG: hypothetical protein A3C35_03860 [Omnitrophica bacterium RIFCSPHIGHO2_02_FULL_46_11]
MVDTHLTLLKEKGFKLTPLRRALLEVFRKRRSAMTAEKLHTEVRRRLPNPGLQSVYRNLGDFTKLGIAEEIFHGKKKAAFALCRGISTHHHHAVCRRCGLSDEIDSCELDLISRAMSRLFRRLKRKIGFHIEDHFLQLEGLCRACQKKRA